MYQPTLRPDQVRALYILKRWLRKPMTKLLREAVDEYLKVQSEQYRHLVTDAPARR
jgi:hypothetical protein